MRADQYLRTTATTLPKSWAWVPSIVVLRIFRHEPGRSILAAEGLDGGLVLEAGHHDLPAVEFLPAVDHHQVPGQDAGVQHGYLPDPEGKILPGPSAGVKGQVFLHALFGQDGCAGRHTAHHGHPVGAALQLLHNGLGAAHHGDGPGLALGLGDQARRFQSFEVEMDCGRGFEAHMLADLPYRRGYPCSDWNEMMNS